MHLLHHELQDLITQMREEISKDIVTPTTIPATYQEILKQLTQAEQALIAGDLDTVIDLIGEINLDLLEQVDAFDASISMLMQQIKTIKQRYQTLAQPLPHDLQQALDKLQETVKQYALD